MTVLAIVFLAWAAIAAALLTARPRLRVRLVVVVCAAPLAFAVWQSAQPPAGWPAHVKPPKLAEFKWGTVREPDVLTKDPGEIDLWLIPQGAIRPRAYRLPYTRQLHEQLHAATAAVKSGSHVGVRPSGRENIEGEFIFYRLPPPRPPAKRG